MPRYEKGILGVKKDPKKRIIFSFGVGKGSEEWPSDDSEDSDYEPAGFNEEAKLEIPRKRKRTKKLQNSSNEDSDYEPEITPKKLTKRKSRDDTKQQNHCSLNHKMKLHKNTTKKSKSETSKDGMGKRKSVTKSSVEAYKKRILENNEPTTGNIWGAQIPPEVLTKIFMYVVDQNGSLPFLTRACRVCQLWNAVASDLVLWKNVDLSFGWIKKSDLCFYWLCDNKLPQVRSLDLSGWEKIVKDEQLQYLGKKCPNLEDIILKGCTKINAESLMKLVSSCEDLHSLDLSHQENQQNSRIKADFTMAKHLNTLIEQMGNRLRKLNLANHSLANFNVVLKAITQHCTSLRELDLSGVKFSSDYLTLDIDSFQKGCPRLRTLRLNCAMIRPAAHSQLVGGDTGWDDLEELQVGTWNQSYTGITESTLQSLLKTSQNLRLLNIRGCKSIGARVLSDLCCSDLEQLYMTWTKVPNSGCLVNVFKKWSHSLQELDMAWCGSYCESFAQDLSALNHPNSKLHTLDLSGSTIDMDALRSLLSCCRHISTLAVSSCRSLDPCYKRRYTRPKEIQELRRKLKI